MILIEHPEHGRMHVYNNIDLEAHLAIGWKPVDEHVQLTENKADLSPEKSEPIPSQGVKRKGFQKGHKGFQKRAK